MEINNDSGQIEIIGPYGRVYLYTHNSANSLVAVVNNVLSKKLRWDDPDYLSRMIFCKMVPESEWDSELNFGIGTQMYIDIKMLITINTVNQTIKISSFYNESTPSSITMPILDFVNDFVNNAEF